MKAFQKKKENQTSEFRSSDWIKGKAFSQQKTMKVKPISYRGSQHRG